MRKVDLVDQSRIGEDNLGGVLFHTDAPCIVREQVYLDEHPKMAVPFCNVRHGIGMGRDR